MSVVPVPLLKIYRNIRYSTVRYRYLKVKFCILSVTYRTGTDIENAKNGYRYQKKSVQEIRRYRYPVPNAHPYVKMI
ncbi:hypothetical protein Hanom_Chr09g00819191 [Helianthus anomalus]